MADDRKRQDATAGGDGAAGSAPIATATLSPQQVYAEIGKLITFLSPGCGQISNIRLRFETAGVGPTVLSIPAPVAADDSDAGDDTYGNVELMKPHRLREAIIRHFASKPADYTAKGARISNALKEPDDTLRKHYSALQTFGVLKNMGYGEGYGRGPSFDRALEMLDE